MNGDAAVEPSRHVAEPSDVPIALTHAKRFSLTLPTSNPASEPPVSEHADADEIASPVDAMSKVVASLHASPKSNAERWSTGSVQPPAISMHTTPLAMRSHIDTRSMVSDMAPREGQSLQSLAPRVEREGQSLASRVDASIQAEFASVQSTGGLSLAVLWSDTEQDTVSRIESAILNGEMRDALLLVDVLVQRSLEQFGSEIGQPALDPNVLMMMLGVRGESILEFRNTCARARVSTALPSTDNALSALVFATQLRLHIRRARS